jgi:hypothetical protein
MCYPSSERHRCEVRKPEQRFCRRGRLDESQVAVVGLCPQVLDHCVVAVLLLPILAAFHHQQPDGFGQQAVAALKDRSKSAQALGAGLLTVPVHLVVLGDDAHLATAVIPKPVAQVLCTSAAV